MNPALAIQSTVQSSNGGAVNVRSLICHRDVELSLHCLRSLAESSTDPVRFVLHEDGSLTEQDREDIRAGLSNVTILNRHEADQRMAEALRAHPVAAKFRADSVWGLKLLDIVLLEPDTCFYSDGDIRYFRTFAGLFRQSAASGRAIFLADTVWQAYSIRPWHLLGRRALRVASGINTGLTIIPRALYDLDFVEWFLSQPDWRCIPAWTEPTCWAALAARSNGHVVSPEQIVNLYPGAEISAQAFAGHFLSSHRRFWRDALYREATVLREPLKAKLKPCSDCSPIELSVSQLKRKIQNTVDRGWAN